MSLIEPTRNYKGLRTGKPGLTRPQHDGSRKGCELQPSVGARLPPPIKARISELRALARSPRNEAAFC